jgi:hypothetical protein
MMGNEKKERFPLYLELELKEELEREAKEENRSLNNYIAYLLKTRHTKKDVEK